MILSEIDYIGYFSMNKVTAEHNTKKRPVLMFEIEFCTEDGGILYLDDKAIPIRKNCIICAKPGQQRYTKGILRCYYLHFDIKNNQLRNILLKLPDAFLIESEEKYKNIFIDLCRYFNKNSDDSKIMLESLILKLIYSLKHDSLEAEIFSGVESKQAEITKKAVNYIKEHLNEDLSLEKLAKHFSFSPTYFHKIFKATMNKTLRDFVEERRIKKAKDMLLTTSMSLTEIAYECGFSSQSYFCYAFKRYEGTTPNKFIKNSNNH